MDFSCLRCVGVCRWRGQSDDRHADVFNCSRSESERGGETAANRQTAMGVERKKDADAL